jgi:transcriptional regulator GlxA family with amidase domain
MGLTQMIQQSSLIPGSNQSSHDPALEHSSLRVVTGYLDAALRMWDEDSTQAKWQIKVAAAMLRSYADGSAESGTHATAPSGLPGLAPWQAREVQEFIDDSLAARIRVRDCASKAQLSARQFSNAFKTTFGETVSHYVRCRRIERAQQLMLLSTQPLSQIAVACGFADQAHFCRAFREFAGLSPNAWRRQSTKPGEG